MATASTVRQRLARAITGVGLKETPLVFDAAQVTTSRSHQTFTLSFPDSADTGKQRVGNGQNEGDSYRVAHTITATLLHHLRQKDQEVTVDLALDDAEGAVRAVLTDLELNEDARVEYRSTRRRLTASGDYLESVLALDIETTVPITS